MKSLRLEGSMPQEITAIRNQLKDLKEFDIKNMQAHLQFDLQDIKAGLAADVRKEDRIPDVEKEKSTSAERFKKSTDKIRKEGYLEGECLESMESGPGHKSIPPHMGRQASNVLRDNTMWPEEERHGNTHQQYYGESKHPGITPYQEREEVHRVINPRDYPKNEQFPRFSGEGTYDLYGFVSKIEMIKKDFQMVDETILARMSLILDGQAALWYESQRENYDKISWEDFKRKLLKEYDTLVWQKKVAFDCEKDKFFPNNVDNPSAWVVRQSKRLKILERSSTNHQIIHKLMLRIPGSVNNVLEGRITPDMTIHEFGQTFVNIVENSGLRSEARNYLESRSNRKTQQRVVQQRNTRETPRHPESNLEPKESTWRQNLKDP